MGRSSRPWRRLLPLVLTTYGTTCHLCLLPIRLDLPAKHPDGPSADHIIPVKRGGLDTLDNLRPAHRRCNYSRGARPLTPSLLASFRRRRVPESGAGFFAQSAGHPAPPVRLSPDTPKKAAETAGYPQNRAEKRGESS